MTVDEIKKTIDDLKFSIDSLKATADKLKKASNEIKMQLEYYKTDTDITLVQEYKNIRIGYDKSLNNVNKYINIIVDHLFSNAKSLTKVNKKYAIEIYKIAADNGNINGMYEYAKLIKKQIKMKPVNI